MNKEMIRLNVFFEEPFWIGICERIVDDQFSVCKITFGAEPKDYTVEEFILRNWNNLKFSPTLVNTECVKQRINPKRMQRDVRKQIQSIGIGTKSQQALKLQQEDINLNRKIKNRKRKEEELVLQFSIKQQKKKEKHKGR